MKKCFPYASLAALLGGMAAMLLRLWFFMAGPDSSGLYPRFHISQLLLWALTAGMLLFFLLLSRQTEAVRPFEESFPASPVGAIGHLAATLGIGIVSIQGLLAQDELFSRLLSLLGLVCSGLLAWGGYLRLKGRKQPGLVYALPTAFFALRLLFMGKMLSADPKLTVHLFPFAAALAAMLACYQLWGFSADAGDRRKSCFWSLTAGFLCLAAAPGTADIFLYGGTALWLLQDLCVPAPQPPADTEPPQEAPEAEADQTPADPGDIPQ